MKNSFKIVLAMCALFLTCTTPQKQEIAAQKPEPQPMLRGIYIPYGRSLDTAWTEAMIANGKSAKINCAVIDVHPCGYHIAKMSDEVLALYRAAGYRIVARVVCFPEGLTRLPVSTEYMNRLYATMEYAVAKDIDELQLDYIRFHDGNSPYALQVKYDFIDSILVRAREICSVQNRQLSADLFGRVPFNQNDNIGQRVENFAKRVDVIYPMLYPSHFTDCEWYLRDPGRAIHDGTTRCLDRTKEQQIKIVPYIQAFTYNIGWAGTNLEGYIAMQVKAAEATPARAWIAWNARGDYSPLINAIISLDQAPEVETATVQ